MRQADLFAPKPEAHPFAETGERLWALARRGVWFGSSSWKYESWKGAVYCDPYRSKKDFEENCLEEYAKLIPAVGGDFSFYNWPSLEMVDAIARQTPAGFKIGLKATDLVTLRKFPSIPRWGDKAGKPNPDFLNAALFKNEFLDRVEKLEGKLAPIILEFTAFPPGAFRDWTEFADRLDDFFAELRRLVGTRFEFGVELRTRDFFHDELFERLEAMNMHLPVAPILNSWTRMPPLTEQWKLFERRDFPFAECRAVMRPGRTRDEAVELFEPYDRNKETCLPVRAALKTMAEWAMRERKPLYAFINNHVEGCAHQTISEVTAEILRDAG
ncbi:MAG: DUF72 domain-containing protein [Deltaproteobacteria bacterium]|nr:DUF72 domain-containing protein [Deltaproteobacteria bacterium]